MYKVVRKSGATRRQISEDKSVENYITKDVLKEVSLAVTEGNNFQTNEETKYNRIFFVLKGKLKLEFNGKKVSLEKDDSCYISKGTSYGISGTFKAVVVNQPAFGTK